MNATNEVKEFLETLQRASQIDGATLAQVIEDDERVIRKEVTDNILSRKMRLDNTWSTYQLSDVDVIYDEDMLKFADRMDMFGIRGDVPPVRSDDTGIVIVYKFSSYDAYGGVSDFINAFRVILNQNNGVVRNRRIVMYG
jgi:hypothetical protein